MFKINTSGDRGQGIGHRNIILLATSLLLVFYANNLWCKQPQRIVSLAPSVTRSLYSLGLEKNIAGVTIYCPNPYKKTIIGTVLEPNIEKILTLKPDLVIATKEGNKASTVESLKNLGIKAYVVDSTNNFEETCKEFLALAAVLEQKNTAEKIVNDSRRKISDAQKRMKKKENLKVFWQVGSKPIYTVSKLSFMNDFIELSACTNIFKDIPVRYPQISIEEIFNKDPDAIFIVLMDELSIEEKNKWLKNKEMKAVKNNLVFLIKDPIFMNPTPETMAEGVDIITKLLSGETK